MPTLWDLFSLFPACAGVIPVDRLHAGHGLPFPRLCGGDPLSKSEMLDKWRFSPPVRG